MPPLILADLFLLAAVIVGAMGVVRHPGLRMAVASITANTIGWVLWLVAKVAPVIAVQLAKGLVTSFEKDRETWADVVGVFTSELTGIVSPAGSVREPTVGVKAGTAATIAQPLARAIAGAIAPTGEMTPESGQAHLETLIGLMFALGLQGWWVEVVGEIVSLGRFKAAGDLPDAVERGVGLSRLGRLAWRTPIKKAIAEPLEELYNRRYRFKKLTIGEATQLWHRGQIDDATFLDAAEAAGFSHDRAAQLLELGKRVYDLSQVRDLDRLVGLSDPVLLDLIREQGYTGGRADTILSLLRAKEEETVLRELADQARRLYRTGRLTQPQLEAILVEAHFPPNERGIILATEDLIRANERQLTASEVQIAFRETAIDAPEARRRLRELGYRDADIDVLLSTHRRGLTSAQVVDAVVRGRITRDQARARLLQSGYSAEDADLIVSLQGRRLSEGQVLDALREGVINAQVARADLVALGFGGDQVDILIAFIRRQLSPADVQAAVLRGLLTPQQGVEKLVREGFTPDDAELIITLRRRLLSTGEVLDAFEAGILTRVEALRDLDARGFAPDDALTIVRVFELRLQARLARVAAGQAAPAPALRRPPAPSGRRRGTTGAPPAAPAP